MLLINRAKILMEPKAKILELNSKLLKSIVAQDWDTYKSLCDPTLTCFEPEAQGHLVEGMDFHKFYFDLPQTSSTQQATMSSPNVRLLGDSVAIVTYVRLN
jgi:calcium/calmodulin-dependent protein kinase (CaM kinase) II